MSKLQNLIEKRGKVADQLQDMRDHLDNFTEEREVEFNNLSNQYDDLSVQIDRLEKLDQVSNDMDKFKPTQKPEVGQSAGSKYGSKEYERDFENFVRSKGKVSNALEAGVDSEGGYIVAESWENSLNQLLFDAVVMRQVATVRTYETDRNIPLVASVGAAGWIDEEASYPTNSAAFGNAKLVAHKLGNIELVSEELLADSIVNLRSELGLMYANSFGATEEAAFVAGDGTGKPEGFLVGGTSAFTAAGAAVLTYDEVIDLIAAVPEKYAMNGVWQASRATIAALRKLKDSNGMPLWQPAMTAGMPDTLFGKDLRANEAMPDIATGEKALAFGDFSQYRIADRLGLQMQVLSERYADTGQVGFKFTKRTDGKLLRADAVQYITMG